ncbi:hypothetical protein HK104_005269 [Borealophlyctis nickersoniae]|nr:hypothetical protein HK104_005269 [Borealophlyctis nickersoniae]
MQCAVDDLPESIVEAAWEAFLSRLDLCHKILKLCPSLRDVDVFLDVDTDERSINELNRFRDMLLHIGSAVACMRDRGRVVSAQVRWRAISSSEPAFIIRPFIETLGKSVRILSLIGLGGWAPGDVTTVLRSVGELKMLELCGGYMSTSAMKEVERHTPTLRELIFQSTSAGALEDDTLFDSILPNARNLERFVLSNEVVRWRHSSKRQYVLGCAALRHLDVDHCVGLSSSFFDTVARTCPLLETFSAGGIPALTDTNMKAIVSGCPRLTELHLGRCEGLTIESLEAIAEIGLAHLRIITLHGSPRVVNEGGADVLPRLLAVCPNLTDLTIGPVHPVPETVGWRVLAIARQIMEEDKPVGLRGDRYPVLDLEYLRRVPRLLRENKRSWQDLAALHVVYGDGCRCLCE